MLGDSLFKKAIENKFEGMSPVERGQFLQMLDKNPDLFMKIAREFQQKISDGKNQMDAAMEVMKNHESELKAIEQS